MACSQAVWIEGIYLVKLTVIFLSAALPTATHTQKKEIKKKKATPQPRGVSALGNFFEQRCNLAFLPERKCRVMLQRGPSPHSAASREKGGGQEENAKDL